MQYWLRHGILMVLCVVLPFGLALYFDTASEIDRSKNLGAQATDVALSGLQARLELEAFQLVAKAQELAEESLQGVSLAALNREASYGRVASELAAGMPEDGFAWLLGPDGTVLARHDASLPLPEADRDSWAGHPAFVQSQLGFALDTVLMVDRKPFFVATVPWVQDGAASGAVMLGRPIDASWLGSMETQLSAELAFASGAQTFAATLPEHNVTSFRQEGGFEKGDAIHFGRLSTPLQAFLPGMPLFVDADAQGLAFTARQKPMPGSSELRWMVAVKSGSTLRALPERQLMVLAGLLASSMVLVLVGLINARTFVRPIASIEQHLSEIQLGRGEMELPERRVPGPFRRLVRLINMTVQKVPARGLSSITDRPAWAEPEPASPSSPGGRARIPSAPELPPAPPSASSPGAPLEAATSPPTPASSIPSFADGLQELEDRPEPAWMAAAGPATTPSAPPLDPGHTGSLSTQPLAVADMPPAAEPHVLDPAAPAPSDPWGSQPDPVDSDPDPAQSVAGALDGLMAEDGANTEAARTRRRASEIRGGQPLLHGFDEGLEVELSKSPAFSSESSSSGGSSGLRTGGSLDEGGSSDLGLSAGVGLGRATDDAPESTVVAPVAQDLLAKSAAPDALDFAPSGAQRMKESTVVASVPDNLIERSKAVDEEGGDSEEEAHFREVFDRFVQMRKQCGEAVDNLVFDRFVQKLHKNRDALIKKYNCRTVRFQVYEKDGKAALKASPVRTGR